MTKFIIIADTHAPLAARNALTIRLKELGRWGWWHWFENIWLVVDPAERTTAQELRDVAGAALGFANVLVIRVEHADWAGLAPPAMFQWIRDTWDTK